MNTACPACKSLTPRLEGTLNGKIIAFARAGFGMASHDLMTSHFWSAKIQVTSRSDSFFAIYTSEIGAPTRNIHFIKTSFQIGRAANFNCFLNPPPLATGYWKKKDIILVVNRFSTTITPRKGGYKWALS